MALGIYTNTYSLTAQNNLNTANTGLAKSIERLSSGLRINHASDDASGLAISEKLRGQIRGMAKASLNAQDAVSMLQTAEGGMEVIGSMLQRMRELAVQAGNGTYTSNDRSELQKEVNQLKDEVNRIASSTEYNTKKLLTGDAAALWSSSSNNVEAIVRGTPAEGNYIIDYQAAGGRNYVYKTDIMTVNGGESMSHYVSDKSSTHISTVNLNGWNVSDGDLQAKFDTITAAADTSAVATSVTKYGLTGNVTLTVSGITSDDAGYYQFVLKGKVTSMTTLTSVDYEIYHIGADGQKTKMNVDITSSTATAIKFKNADLTAGGSITMTFAGLSASKTGDSVLFGVSQNFTTGSTTIAVNHTNTAGGTTKDNLISKTSVVTWAMTSAGGSATTVTMDTATGSLRINTVEFDELSAAWRDGTATLAADKEGISALANGDTKLKDIDRFVNADGRNILDNTQTLTIFGNGKEVEVYIEGNDTVDDLVAKLNKAITKDLGMGGGLDSVVKYVEGDENVNGGMFGTKGTFVIQSGMLGANSQLNFIGDEGLINALSLATLQEGADSDITVTVRDAHNPNKVIGSDTVSDNILRGVIDGIDVKINNPSYTAIMDPNGNVTYTHTQGSSFLHVVDNRTDVQIGANEGQVMNVSIGEISTTALEIDDAFVNTMENAQKAITKFDRALEKVTSMRATIGAQINRLDYTMQNLSVSRQNLVSAESRIRDLDVAEESANFANKQVLVNAAVAMLAQANQLPQTALQLIGR